MKTSAVTPNSFQLTRFGLVNCFLVREQGSEGEPDGFTLIDTGLSGSEDAILAAAQAAGTPIHRILLTHAHTDHVGSVDALIGSLKSNGITPQLAASVRSVPLLATPPDKTLAPGEPARKIKGSVPGIRSRLTHFLAEGELYGSLRVFETPGHIPGHLSFLDERDGTLYAGDALVGIGHLSISGYAPWYFPLPNLATWDKSLALASARKLATLPIARFACGHGPLRPGGAAALTQAIARASA